MQCPFCNEVIADGAIKCKHCGEVLDHARHAALVKAAPSPAMGDKAESEQENTGSRPLASLVGLGSIALLAYAAWTAAHMLPVIGPMISKASEPENLLEKAMTINQSTRPDYEKLMDSGGLNTYSSWQGLHVASFEAGYAKDGKLTTLSLLVDGTAKWSSNSNKWYAGSTSVAPAAVREVLAKVCENEKWKVTETGGVAEKAIGAGRTLSCSYNLWREGSSDLFVVIQALETKRDASAQEVATKEEPAASSKPEPPPIAINSDKTASLEVARPVDVASPPAVSGAQGVAVSPVTQPSPVAGTPGPSFDCEKAQTVVEKLICADAELARQDRDVWALFQQARSAAPDKTAFTDTARLELKRRNTCADRNCIASWYEARRQQLQQR